MSQTPKNRIDLLPHYSRFIAILNKYLPDVGSDLVSVVSEPFFIHVDKRDSLRNCYLAR